MGIGGLTSFVDKIGIGKLQTFPLKSYWEKRKLLVVDGSALIHHVFCYTCSHWILGGDYDDMLSYLQAYITVLQACGFELFFVFDGFVPPEKLETVLKREKQKISLLEKEVYHSHILPPFAYFPVIKFLKEQGFGVHISCKKEADEIIAGIAKQLNGYVFSNDSDFLVYNGIRGYIPIRDFALPRFLIEEIKGNIDKFQFSKSHVVNATVYTSDDLASFFHFRPTYMPIFGTLVGNDYCAGKKERKGLHDNIRFIADTIRKCQNILPLETDIEEMVQKISEVLSLNNDEVLAVNHCVYTFAQKDVKMLEILCEVKARSDLIEMLEHACISRKFSNFFVNRSFICGNYAEPSSEFPNSWEVTVPLRKFMYSLLDHLSDNVMSGADILEYRRAGSNFTEIRVSPSTSEELFKFLPGNITQMNDFESKEPEMWLRIIAKFCKVRTIPHNTSLFPVIASFAFMKDIGFPIEYFFAIASACIVARNSRDSTAVHADINPKAISKPIRYFLCCYQNVLHHIFMFMECLGIEVESALIRKFYNGDQMSGLIADLSGGYRDISTEKQASRVLEMAGIVNSKCFK